MQLLLFCVILVNLYLMQLWTYLPSDFVEIKRVISLQGGACSLLRLLKLTQFRIDKSLLKFKRIIFVKKSLLLLLK